MLVKLKVYRNTNNPDIIEKEDLVIRDKVLNIFDVSTFEQQILQDGEEVTRVYSIHGENDMSIETVVMTIDEFCALYTDLTGLRIHEI